MNQSTVSIRSRSRWHVFVFALVLSGLALADTGCSKKKKEEPGVDGKPAAGGVAKKAKKKNVQPEIGIRL